MAKNKGNAPGGSDRRVNRGDKLRIDAKTWNQLQEMKAAYYRDKASIGADGEYTSEVNPQLTVLLENKAEQAIKAFRAYKVQDVSVNPANHPYAFNRRPAVHVGIVDDVTNAIAITLSPIEDEKTNRGVIKGYCVCRVKINDPTDDWAIPVAGETYLESAESGTARIIWFGTVTDSVESGESVDSAPDEESGEEISGSGEDADVYWALVDLIGSSAAGSCEGIVCSDYYTSNLGVGGAVEYSMSSGGEVTVWQTMTPLPFDIDILIQAAIVAGSFTHASNNETKVKGKLVLCDASGSVIGNLSGWVALGWHTNNSGSYFTLDPPMGSYGTNSYGRQGVAAKRVNLSSAFYGSPVFAAWRLGFTTSLGVSRTVAVDGIGSLTHIVYSSGCGACEPVEPTEPE